MAASRGRLETRRSATTHFTTSSYVRGTIGKTWWLLPRSVKKMRDIWSDPGRFGSNSTTSRIRRTNESSVLPTNHEHTTYLRREVLPARPGQALATRINQNMKARNTKQSTSARSSEKKNQSHPRIIRTYVETYSECQKARDNIVQISTNSTGMAREQKA